MKDKGLAARNAIGGGTRVEAPPKCVPDDSFPA